ncbi:MAG: flavin-containing monooxygenase [Acidimicrobiia bacterium]
MSEHLSVEELRRKYEAEKLKRLRAEGIGQYVELKGQFADFDKDLYCEPFEREAVTEDVEVLIVGGGFAGMLTAVRLGKEGITNFRLVEKAGDFGGTWYWNRYPGCMCDVESYTYLPLLEETGYMPTERYASAEEIFQYCQLIGRHFDLYSHSLFQTTINGSVWNEGRKRWDVTTSRGDKISARFVVVAGGILHKAKLPGIPGILDYKGKSFHTSHWDYAYTGGAPRKPMVNLKDKVVGIIGTGATAVQAVPRLAETAKELYVFQRTPAAVGIRGQAPTDVEWFKSLKPGWHAERVVNFTNAVTGRQPEKNLVDDGWTHVMWVNTQKATDDPDELAELERSDFETMQALRDRIDEVVHDAATADKLKPWYAKNCKRVCFHDEYLQSFNQPNVHLVDTDGRGVDRITEKGVVVGDTEYPVDLLIFASGFETNTEYQNRVGFDPVGRDGVHLSDKWADGPHTLHGILADGFPNFMIISFMQAGFGTNFVHFLNRSADHVGKLIKICEKTGIETIEASRDGEEEWLGVLYINAAGPARYAPYCTPSYYNNEQQAPDARAARNLVFANSLLDYANILDTWREEGSLHGTKVIYSKR